MKYIFKKINTLHPIARFALSAGLVTILFFCFVLLSYVCRTDSLLFCLELVECIPALAVSVPIVFGGTIALDAVLKGK